MTFVSISCPGGALLWQGLSPCVFVPAAPKKAIPVRPHANAGARRPAGGAKKRRSH